MSSLKTLNSHWNSRLDAEVCPFEVRPTYARTDQFFDKKKKKQVEEAKMKMRGESKQGFPSFSSSDSTQPRCVVQIYIRGYSHAWPPSLLGKWAARSTKGQRNIVIVTTTNLGRITNSVSVEIKKLIFAMANICVVIPSFSNKFVCHNLWPSWFNCSLSVYLYLIFQSNLSYVINKIIFKDLIYNDKRRNFIYSDSRLDCVW